MRTQSVHFDRENLSLVISFINGAEMRVPARLIEGIDGADPDSLETAEVSPSGLGVYFPVIDLDIYVPGLLDGVFGSKAWMASLKAHVTPNNGVRDGPSNQKTPPESVEGYPV